MKKILLIALIIVSINTANAGTCSGNRCTGKISLLYVHNNGKVYVQLDSTNWSTSDTILGCTKNNNSVILTQNSLNHDEMYSMLLSTKLADKEIILRLSDVASTSSDCTIAYMMLY